MPTIKCERPIHGLNQALERHRPHQVSVGRPAKAILRYREHREEGLPVERQAARQGHRVGPVGQHRGANVPFGEGDFPRRHGSVYSPALGIRHGQPALGHHGAASPLRKHRLHGVGVQEVIGVEQEDHIAASEPGSPR